MQVEFQKLYYIAVKSSVINREMKYKHMVGFITIENCYFKIMLSLPGFHSFIYSKGCI